MARALLLPVLALAAFAAEDDAVRTARLKAEATSLLDALEGEVRRREIAGNAEEADALAARIASLRERLATAALPSPGDLPEVHVVAIERGTPGTYGGLPRGNAVVEVECPGRPLVLVLGCANAMHWDLRLAEGVEIVEVWHCGDARHWVRGVSWDQVKRLGEDFAWRREDRRFAAMEAAIAKATGLGITTFFGAETPGAEPVHLGPQSEIWRIEQVHAESARLHWAALRADRARAAARVASLRFEAGWPTWAGEPDEGGQFFAGYGAFTPLGPILETHKDLPRELARARAVVRDAAGSALYAITARGLLQFDLATRRRTQVRVPEQWPQVRDPRGLALDTRRRRVLMATRQDAGYLYAYDLERREWSVLGDMDHVDVAGLCYDPSSDSVWCAGYGDAGGLVIHRIAPDGAWIGEEPLRVRPPDDLRRPVQLRAAGGLAVVVHAPVPDRRRPGSYAVWAWVAEPLTGQVLFETVQRPFHGEAPLAPGERETLWAALVTEHAETRARRLADGDDATVSFIRERLAGGAPAPTPDIAGWVRRLDDDRPAVRQQAQVFLQAMGGEAQEALSEAARTASSPEMRQRLKEALRHVRETAQRDLKRALWGVRVLEWIDSPASFALLEELAGRGGDIGRSARAAVLRMSLPP